MRILTFARESYPVSHPASFVALHQNMALEELGHLVHLYRLDRPPMPLNDYLEAFDFDLFFCDIELLASRNLWETLYKFRAREAVRMVAVQYTPDGAHDAAWDLIDFAVTPWRGPSVEARARARDLRYLPLGYNGALHKPQATETEIGPVFVGNVTGMKSAEAESYLAALRSDHVVLCVGPGSEQPYLDPFALGRVYASARCLPNFHHESEKGRDAMLNERFWQSARCGTPVNDYSWLMSELWDEELTKAFCFADKARWQARVRALHAGTAALEPEMLARLRESVREHSYAHRMRQLLDWLA